MTMLNDDTALCLVADLGGVRYGQNCVPFIVQVVENLHDKLLILLVEVARRQG